MKDKKKHPVRVAILGDSATQFWEVAFRQQKNIINVEYEIYNAPYNQINYEIYQKDSNLYQFLPDYIILFMCVEKMYERFCLAAYEERETWAQREFEQIKNYWETLNLDLNVQIFQLGFLEYDDRIFGNYAYKMKNSFVCQMKVLNLLIIYECRKRSNVIFFDIQNYYISFGRNFIRDYNLYYNADMVFNFEITEMLVSDITRYIQRDRGHYIKCLVIDLDDTIWGGNVADLGPLGVEIGGTGVGLVYREIQLWLKELKKRGILLAVCSKNNLYDAKQPFIHNKEMILKLDDFVEFQVNWEDKASNIIAIQKKLNIGLDSIAFLDNSSYERKYVLEMLPECLVIDLPHRTEEYLNYLRRINLFETIAFSDEDIKKTSQYRTNEQREEHKKLYLTYKDYLKELCVEVEIINFSKSYMNRVMQLIQKTNQFNFRSIRYTRNDIEELAQNKNFRIIIFSARDKFGERGAIGLLILKKLSIKTVFIDSWILSCRAFNLGIEDVMLDEIMKCAKAEGVEYVLGEYIENGRNENIRNFFLNKGFRTFGRNLWFIKTKEYKKQEVNISKISYAKK